MYSQNGYHNGTQHNSWQQTQFGAGPAASQQQAHYGSISNMQHSYSSSLGAPPASTSWDGSNYTQQQSGRAPQQREAPAAAGGPSFNYGFGQMPPGPTVPLIPSAAPVSSMQHQQWSHTGYANNQWQTDHQSTHAEAQQSAAAAAYPGAEPDSLKSVKDLPAVFQPIFNFRCV